MKVLLVEDDILTLEWSTIFLKSKGLEVKAVDSLLRAHECLCDWLPDVIVSDVSLKGENALDFVDQLQADTRTAGIPVIAVSGYILGQAQRKKFHDYLMKPVHPDQLLASILKAADGTK